MRRALALILCLVSTGPAVADTLGTKGPHKEGEYGGVVPGEKPQGTKPRRAPAKGTLSWIGFEAKGGGAQVFFQSPGSFELNQRVEGSTLVVHLMLQRMGPNTWRQVDTRFFENPLSGITAKAVRFARSSKERSPAGIEVRIQFKNPRDAREGSMTTKTEPDGMYYAYLTFPEGSSDAATKTTPAK